jgi:hypothetical protein
MSFWDNPEHDKELMHRWIAGEPASAIGAALGISKHAVIGRAHRIAAPSRATKKTIARYADGVIYKKFRSTDLRGCRYIADGDYCGEITLPNSSWCEAHHAIVHVKAVVKA